MLIFGMIGFQERNDLWHAEGVSLALIAETI